MSETVRDVLRRTLGDPDLEIVYPRVGSGGWIDGLGAGSAIVTAGRAVTAIDRGGKPVAALVHDRALLEDRARLDAAIEAVSLAIDNERLKAQLQAQLAEVQASRARIVDAGDRELRRVERNLHDGAQQRLVGLALLLRLAAREASANAHTELTHLLADATRELDDAVRELRELARGIHPAIVDDAGLGAAIETLAERPGVPVVLHVEVPDRLPAAVEVGAYYLVAEALTNVNKHADATEAIVRATVHDGALQVAVTDDGTGGADARPGSGLEGLADRVEALGGELSVDSGARRGTTVSATIPLAVLPDGVGARRRLNAIRWLGWENFEGPPELYEQITDEDNLVHGKTMLLCAGGNRQITPREREWLIGYLTAAGFSDPVLDQLEAYDDADSLADLMALPGMPAVALGLLYDGIRIATADGPLTVAELDHLHRAAAGIGVPADVLAELIEIVAADNDRRHRRYELIVRPVIGAGP
jgi:signal transduction histidine kinase